MVELLAARPEVAAVLLDFDGSLSAIEIDPEKVTAPAATLALLSRLAERLALVAIVSGRPLDFLDRVVPIPSIELFGQYGLERRVDGRTVVEPAALPYREAVAAAADEAARRWPELLIERKGEIAVTVHWRAMGEISDARVAEIDALGTRLGLAVYPTRMARELRPPLTLDKGTAVCALLADTPGVTRAAYAGDDRGDLPAFDALAALAERGDLDGIVRVAVDSEEAPGELVERADLVVAGPAGLFDWLTALADALTA
jgi:trehalose 6-phosphate phosphatase